MLTYVGAPQLPSGDKRWKIVEATARRHGREPHALIETLHTVQECFGYLDENALRFVASVLRVPLSRVSKRPGYGMGIAPRVTLLPALVPQNG